MGGTRIYVLQLKEIIKTALFALAGLAVILLLIYLFIPRNKPEVQGTVAPLFTPGTYTAEIILHNNPVDVDVTVSESEILSVKMTDMVETQEVFYPLFSPAMETLSKEIVKNQSTEIVPSSDYPVTGEIILSAVRSALDQASVNEEAVQ